MTKTSFNASRALPRFLPTQGFPDYLVTAVPQAKAAGIYEVLTGDLDGVYPDGSNLTRFDLSSDLRAMKGRLEATRITYARETDPARRTELHRTLEVEQEVLRVMWLEHAEREFAQLKANTWCALITAIADNARALTIVRTHCGNDEEPAVAWAALNAELGAARDCTRFQLYDDFILLKIGATEDLSEYLQRVSHLFLRMKEVDNDILPFPAMRLHMVLRGLSGRPEFATLATITRDKECLTEAELTKCLTKLQAHADLVQLDSARRTGRATPLASSGLRHLQLDTVAYTAPSRPAQRSKGSGSKSSPPPPSAGNELCRRCNGAHLRVRCPHVKCNRCGAKGHMRSACNLDTVGLSMVLLDHALFSSSATRFTLLDSGASRSVVGDEWRFNGSIQDAPEHRIVVADGRTVDVDGIGRAYGLDGVLYVRSSPVNLLSLGALLDAGYVLSVTSTGSEMVFTRAATPSVLRFLRHPVYGLWVLEEPTSPSPALTLRSPPALSAAPDAVAVLIVPPAHGGPLSACGTGEASGSAGQTGGDSAEPTLAAAAASSAPPSELLRLHLRFGHANAEALRTLVQHGMVHGLRLSPRDLQQPLPYCEGCSAAKDRRLPFARTNPHRSTVPGAIWNLDLVGPITPVALDGSRYALIATDEGSHYHAVYLLTAKVSIVVHLQRLVAEVITPAGRVLLGLRTDGGSEFNNGDIKKFCRQLRIDLDITTPYDPQSNGLAERANGTLVAMARAMVLHAGLPKSFWCYALVHAAYLRNRLPSRVLDNGTITPYEKLRGIKPDVTRLRIFGASGYYLDRQPDGKLAARSRLGLLVGLSRRGWILYDPLLRKLVHTRHVHFDEHVSSRAGAFAAARSAMAELADDSSSESDSVSSDEDNGGAPPSVPVTSSSAALPASSELVPAAAADAVASIASDAELGAPSALRRSTRTRQPTAKVIANAVGFTLDVDGPALSPDASAPALLAATSASASDVSMSASSPPALPVASTTVVGVAPHSYGEAMSSPERELWEEAITEELDGLLLMQTYVPVPKSSVPAGVRLLTTKWVFRVKLDASGQVIRHKARLVVRGFEQRAGVEFFDTFASVVRMSSLRLLLSLAAFNDWPIRQYDVTRAFLYGALEEQVYVALPEGARDAPDTVWHLQHALYGLRQAPRAWQLHLRGILAALGFARLRYDDNLYMWRAGDEFVILAAFVDDLIAAGSSVSALDRLRDGLTARLQITETAVPKSVLGLKLTRTAAGISVTQPHFAAEIVATLGAAALRTAAVPADAGLILTAADSPSTAADQQLMLQEPYCRYRQLVGKLLYLSTSTRPDVSFAVSQLSRFVSNPGLPHWRALVHLVRYISTTAHVGLFYAADATGLHHPGVPLPSPPRSLGNQLLAYADADWGRDVDTRRSVSGYVFMMNGGPISWRSKQQTTVALSTAEAELVSVCEATKEAVYLRGVLGELGVAQDAATVIMQDNSACIALSKNPEAPARTKHIGLKYFYVRDHVDEGNVQLLYCPSALMLADLLTKPVTREVICKLRPLLLRASGGCGGFCDGGDSDACGDASSHTADARAASTAARSEAPTAANAV